MVRCGATPTELDHGYWRCWWLGLCRRLAVGQTELVLEESRASGEFVHASGEGKVQAMRSGRLDLGFTMLLTEQA